MMWLLVTGLEDLSAQSLEPRMYSNAPMGLNFLLGGYVYSAGNATSDPSIDFENGDLEFHAPFVAYARTFGLWGKSAKVDAVIPYGISTGSGTLNDVTETRNVEGLADPRFRIAMNFFGAPALTMPEFVQSKQDVVAGISLNVSAPLGQYDSDKLLNIGMNRWSFKPELGVSKTMGPFIFELAGAVTLYTENSDYLNGKSREQAPLYSTQGHVIYVFKNNLWIAFDATYYTGGCATINGIEQDVTIQSSRLGGTLAIPVNRNHSVKLYASTGVSARTGTNFDTFGAAWQYRWGGGL